jgi:hypothetical protein
MPTLPTGRMAGEASPNRGPRLLPLCSGFPVRAVVDYLARKSANGRNRQHPHDQSSINLGDNTMNDQHNIKLDTSHLASADIADMILENYEEADKNYDLSWKRINGEDWVRILVKYPQLVDKCDWGEVTNRDWVDLLCEHPEFVELCKDEFWKSGMWKALTENDWARLLKAQPQLAKYKPEQPTDTENRGG